MFINSDPALIRFFLRFLEAAGTLTAPAALFRVYIHENADVAAAQQFWLDVTGRLGRPVRTPTLKHHNPMTVRKNVGDEYHGCLRIDVSGARSLPQDRRLGFGQHGLGPGRRRVPPAEHPVPAIH